MLLIFPVDPQANPVTCKFQNMKLSMFSDIKSPGRHFPKLKGRAIEVRNLGAALLHVCKQKLSESIVHTQVILALQASVRMDQILDEHAGCIMLSADGADEYEKSGFTFLACVTAVADHHHSRGVRLFNITIKFHYLAHAARFARYLNPRLGWNYSGEDFMAKVKKLVGSCVKGTAPHLISARFFQKYTIGMHLRMAHANRLLVA
jgi:hypothetical protein